MDLYRIRALDLRDSEVAHEIDNYGVYWDWPKFPVDTLTFINTGIRPSASHKVIATIRGDVTALKRQLARMEMAAFDMTFGLRFSNQLRMFQRALARKPKRHPVPKLDEWVSHRGW